MSYLNTLQTAFADSAPITKGTAKTTIVVPCCNEVNRLNGAAFLETLAKAPDRSFVFVDDGSTDATILARLALLWANITISPPERSSHDERNPQT